MNKIFILLFSTVFLAASCNSSLPQFNDAAVQINNKKLNVFVADEEQEQRLGLAVRKKISDEEGMLFTFDKPLMPTFWMKDMKFPIDIIWIKNNQVVEVDRDLAPQPGVENQELKLYKPNSEVDAVLEVNAGWAKKNNLSIGDEVIVKFK